MRGPISVAIAARRAIRVGIVVAAAVVLPLSGATALAAESPAPVASCPTSIGSTPLLFSVYDAFDPSSSMTPTGAHGLWQACTYNGGEGATWGDYFATVMWTAEVSTPEPFYCQPTMPPSVPDAVAPDSDREIRYLFDPERRAFVVYSAEAGSADPGAIETIARGMLRDVARVAAPCPGVQSSRIESSAGTTASGSRGLGVGLVAGGLAASIAAGVGSLTAGRTGRVGAGPSSPPPVERIYDGDEAITMLGGAGLIEPVRDATGSLVGYRPLGELGRFIDATPQWQPAFAHPLAVPGGGRATHLVGVAFHEGPDGTFRSISVIVRETPPPAPNEPAASSTASAPARPAPQAPPEPAAVAPPPSPVEPVRPPVRAPVPPVAPPAPAPPAKPATAPASPTPTPAPAKAPPPKAPPPRTVQDVAEGGPPRDPPPGHPPIFRQRSNDSCAVVSVRMIYQRATGSDVPENALRAQSHQMARGYRANVWQWGTETTGTVGHLKELGLPARQGFLSLDQMRRALEGGKQVSVVHDVPGGGFHRVVLSGLETRGPRTLMTFDDPWTGRQFQRSDLWWYRHGSYDDTVLVGEE